MNLTKLNPEALQDNSITASKLKDSYLRKTRSEDYKINQFNIRANGNVDSNNATIKNIYGNSVVWNQLFYPGAGQYENKGLTFTHNGDGTISIKGTVEGPFNLTWPGNMSFKHKTVVGHKYLFGVDKEMPHGFSVYLSGAGSSTTYHTTTMSIVACTSESHYGLYINGLNNQIAGTVYDYTGRCLIVDLTRMFGAGNEPNTIEEFYNRLPNGINLFEYNEGTIINGNYNGIKTTGFNQWDEQWEAGQISSLTGNFVTGGNKIISKNFIPAIPNTSYFITLPLPQDDSHGVYYYDINKQFIQYQWMPSGSNKNQFTTPSNCAFIKFDSWGPTYNNDICINISDESKNGTYEPYIKSNLDLTWIKKYFPTGMKTAGSVKDEIRFNSTTQQWEAVQRVGVVDLGSLNWTYAAIRKYFMAYIEGMYIPSPSYFYKGYLCSKYIQVDFSEIYEEGDTSVPCFGVPANLNQIGVSDSSYTDAETFKAAMAGVMLNYELAEPIVTPITDIVDTFYDIFSGGTELLESELSSNIVLNSAPILDVEFKNTTDNAKLDNLKYVYTTKEYVKEHISMGNWQDSTIPTYYSTGGANGIEYGMRSSGKRITESTSNVSNDYIPTTQLTANMIQSYTDYKVGNVGSQISTIQQDISTLKEKIWFVVDWQPQAYNFFANSKIGDRFVTPNQYTGTIIGKSNPQSMPDGGDKIYIISMDENRYYEIHYNEKASIDNRDIRYTELFNEQNNNWKTYNPNGDGGVPRLIKFSMLLGSSSDAPDYMLAEYGMTWEQWINSKYNNYGYVIENNSIKKSAGATYYYMPTSINDVITESTTYGANSGSGD